MTDTTAAEAAHAEATGKRRVFRWEHQEDGPDGELLVLELAIPRKFKRLKFAKRAGAGDFIGAVEVAFGSGALDPMEEWEMDAEEWERFMTALGEALGGTGNS